jgi:hypothetical protein
MFADGHCFLKFAGLFFCCHPLHPCSFLPHNLAHSHLHLNLLAFIHQNFGGLLTGRLAASAADLAASSCCSRACRLASTWATARSTSPPGRHLAAPASPPGGSRAGTAARGAAGDCGRPKELFNPLKILRTAEKLFIYPQNLLELFGTD